MGHVYFDIETAHIKILHDDIKEYLMDKKISKAKRSLDPNYSKIIMIGVKKNDEETKVIFGDTEKDIITDFWKFLNNNFNAGDMTVTFNGYRFDVPFLNLRTCINKVKMPISINLNPWIMDKSNHFDVMRFFSQNETFTNPSLFILAMLNGIEVAKERIESSEIERLYKNKNWEKIKDHCIQDIVLLEAVFNKLCKDHLQNLQKIK